MHNCSLGVIEWFPYGRVDGLTEGQIGFKRKFVPNNLGEKNNTIF